MAIVKRILSSLVVFIFGLEVGGFGMWYLTMNVLKEPSPRRASRGHVSYADYHNERS